MLCTDINTRHWSAHTHTHRVYKQAHIRQYITHINPRSTNEQDAAGTKQPFINYFSSLWFPGLCLRHCVHARKHFHSRKRRATVTPRDAPSAERDSPKNSPRPVTMTTRETERQERNAATSKTLFGTRPAGGPVLVSVSVVTATSVDGDPSPASNTDTPDYKPKLKSLLLNGLNKSLARWTRTRFIVAKSALLSKPCVPREQALYDLTDSFYRHSRPTLRV